MFGGQRVTGLWTAVGAIIGGIILADLIHNPKGTKVLANSATNTEKISANALLGK